MALDRINATQWISQYFDWALQNSGAIWRTCLIWQVYSLNLLTLRKSRHSVANKYVCFFVLRKENIFHRFRLKVIINLFYDYWHQLNLDILIMSSVRWNLSLAYIKGGLSMSLMSTFNHRLYSLRMSTCTSLGKLDTGSSEQDSKVEDHAYWCPSVDP